MGSLMKALKYISGVKGYTEIKQAKQKKQLAQDKLETAQRETEKRRNALGKVIKGHAEHKLLAITETIAIFLEYLKDINQRYKGRQYEALEAIEVKTETLEEMEAVTISAGSILKGTIATGAVASVALSGVPFVVTAGVGALATASTGTAISTLSGVAATNAILAWLGGGTLAAGGGGMAAGATVLAGITISATAATALLVAGVFLSAHGARMLTKAESYAAEADKAVEQIESLWVMMDAIEERLHEISGLIENLKLRAKDQLIYLEPLIPDFDPDDTYCRECFQTAALLMKAIQEVVVIPIIDETGGVTEESKMITGKIMKLLET